MSRLGRQLENHLVGRIGWLRAAVLGANDGIISTASLNARVTFWGALAMALTAGIGKLFGTVV
jgi:vacuolar iron transporter family protein